MLLRNVSIYINRYVYIYIYISWNLSSFLILYNSLRNQNVHKKYLFSLPMITQEWKKYLWSLWIDFFGLFSLKSPTYTVILLLIFLKLILKDCMIESKCPLWNVLHQQSCETVINVLAYVSFLRIWKCVRFIFIYKIGQYDVCNDLTQKCHSHQFVQLAALCFRPARK